MNSYVTECWDDCSKGLIRKALRVMWKINLIRAGFGAQNGPFLPKVSTHIGYAMEVRGGNGYMLGVERRHAGAGTA
jgi:hypothetical protein